MVDHRLQYRGPQPAPRRSWNRRGILLLAGLVLWLALVLSYVGEAWAMAVYRLILDGGVLALWLAAAAGAGSVLLPLFRATDTAMDAGLLRFVTATALGLGTFSLIILGLGLAGWLNRATAIALLAIGIACGIAELVRRRWRPDALREWLAAPASWGWAGLIVVPFTSLMTVGAMLPPYLLWTPEEPHGYDVVEYHLQVPREWYEAGRIVPLHHNVFSFFPFNVEMHYLLAMQLRGGPWMGMYLAQFMHGAFVVLTVLAVCGLASREDRVPREGTSAMGRGAPVVALIAMAATPWLTQLGAIAYDEGGLLLFGTLAIGWALRGLRDPARLIGRLALAGAMAGFACGSKLTAVPEVLIAIGVLVAVLGSFVPGLRNVPWRMRAAGVGLFGLIGALCFAPWLVRTAVWSRGNPVFPEAQSLLGRGYFSEVQSERWHRAHSPRPDASPAKAAWTEIVASWQYGFLLVPTALAAVIVGRRSPDVWFLGALLFLLAVFWLGFTHLQSRFFILAVPICALLIARLSWAALPVLAIQAAVALVSLNMDFLTPTRRQIIPPALAKEYDLSWLTPQAIQSLPKDAPLVLVGDAKPFVYQRPMSLLSYRTIFDADTSNGRGVIEAWAGPPPATGTQWLLIDPIELERFERTYQPFPPLPAQVTEHREPYMIERHGTAG